MAFTELTYSPATGLSDTTSYVTQPASEAAARAQFQDMFDQVSDYLNDTHLAELKEITTSKSGADLIGSAPIVGVTGTNVWAQISDLKTQIDGVSAGAVSDGSITTIKLADDAVTADKVADSAIGEDQMSANAVTATKLAANAVTTEKILDESVTTTKIADENITTGKLAAEAVTETKIAINAVTDTKIGTRTITDTTSPSSNTAGLTTLLSNIGYMLKSITGKTSWRTVPDVSMATLNSRLGVKITVSATAPSNPSVNDLWVDIS